MNRTDRAIVAALQAQNPVRTLGGAIWLYLALIQTANQRGLVVRTRTRFAESLSISEELIDVYLKRLAEARLIVIKSSSPYLVISFAAWSGDEHQIKPDSTDIERASEQIALDVPVSSSKPLAAAIKTSNGVGGPGEGVTLLAELERAFPEADRFELRRDVETHSEATVRRALERARQTPADQIRKSQLALFRYLLAKLSNERS